MLSFGKMTTLEQQKMKSILAIIIFLIGSIFLYSQNLRGGFTADFLTGNKNISFEAGPSIRLVYMFKYLPISITGSGRIYFSELSQENNFSTGISQNIYSIGASVNYYPVKLTIEPYFGLGAFYNFNTLHRDGTPFPTSDGNIRLPGSIRNNASLELTAGLIFSANTPVNFIVEITQIFSKPSYDLIIINTSDIHSASTTRAEVFNFNSLFFKIGFMFRI